jgi:hypothetical protein
LSRHDLSVNARDGNISVQASLVVGLHNATTKGVLGTRRAVVRTLGTRVSVLGPTQGGDTISVEESVFLFDAEPGLLIELLVKIFVGRGTSIGGDGGHLSIRKNSFTEDDDVVASSEGIGEDTHRLQVDLGVTAGGLSSGRSIVVPDRQLIYRLDFFIESAGLASQIIRGTRTSDPDVFGQDLISLIEGLVSRGDAVVEKMDVSFRHFFIVVF